MLNHHVTAIMENEWAQLRRNKVALFTILAPPVLLVTVGVAVLLLSALLHATSSQIEGTLAPLWTQGHQATYRSGAAMVQSALLSPLLLLFQLIPLVVPMTIASYSIVGEKQSRSLEALLATPIHTWELLLGKALAAALPALLATWLGFDVFALVAWVLLDRALFAELIVGPTWVLGMLMLTPLFAMLAVGVGIIISSKVREPQSAQQFSSLIVLPILGALVGQIVGLVQMSVGFILVTAVAVGLVDLAVLGLAVKLFNRESILIHWR